MFLTLFPLLMPKDQIAPFDLRSFLKIDGIDSLSSIFENIERDRIDRIFKIQSIFRSTITKNDRFDRKTDDRMPNPAYCTRT